MKIKTSELQGAALDWAVTAATEVQFSEYRAVKICRFEATTPAWIERENSPGSAPYFHRYSPSTDWAQGGPIIEREGIQLRSIRREGHALNGHWLAMKADGNTGSMVQWVKRTDWRNHFFEGQTPLIAAMRCYVNSKLGEYVEVPDELLN